MVLELRSFGAPELFNSAPKCTYFAYNGEDAASCSVANAASAANRFDSVEAETSLIRALYLDSKAELAAQTKRLAGELDRATATKLLHLCCNFDSADCASAILGGDLGAVPIVNECDDSGKSPLHTAASAHASRCVEVLLKKHARTDLRTKDGQAQLALELSLADTRTDPNWNPINLSIEDLVIHMSEKDLSTVKLLSEKTKEIADVAYAYAVKGRIASLTALLIAAADKVNDCVLELRDSESGCKEKVTLYECLIREALALGGRATPPLRAAKRASTATEGENSERRKLLLREIELLQLFGAVARSGGGEKKVTSPLIRAAQGGDEAVIQLLLQTNLDVNDADAEGNTALHWILKQPKLLCPQQIRILLLLLDHGARVSQKNRLGLTAFHIAAGNGNSEALEVLLLENPVGVQYKTEMKETPLFFAVKNESKECAELLLTWGANSEVLNLRRQRAIDLATSQDMRYTLLNPTTVSLINHAFPNQHKCTALVLTDEDTTTTTTTERNVNSSAKAAVCKYFDAHRGCVRGAKCFYVQCEEESRKVKEGVDQSYSFATKLLKHKVFVGGLPLSVDSDDLRKFCEQEFGSVEDAIVIVTQIENKIQSRGFGFVTFRQEKSASKAMRAHYITMRGKTVEIKSLIPKLVLGAEFEKMSPQQEQKNFFQFLEEKSNEDIMEGDNPEQGSWAGRLVHGQPTVSSTEPQVTKSSEDPSTPTWLKVFKKWFPVFLRGLSNHPNYALSSLKADFRAKFALELDHSSVGYSKLSDFLVKPFSNLCTVEILPISKGGTSTHMILRPKVSRPKRRLLPTLGAPHNLSLSALIVNGGDSKCHQGLSVDNVGYSECLQNLTIDTCSDTKCLQDLTDDSTVDSQFLEDLSLHGQDSRVFKGIVQKVKGTTCIGWVFEDYVLLGADSRSTFEGEIVTDTRRKLRKLTPLIGATYAGDGSQTSETFAYVKRKMSDDILTGKDVNSVENLGNLCQERNLIDKELAFQFLIGGIQNKVPKCCFVYNNKGSRGLEWVDKCKAIGSGGVHITEMLKGLCLKFGDKAPWEDMVFVVVYLLAIAALDDPCTGGILSARQLGKEHNTGDLCLTVIEVIIRFYTTEHSYLTCGVEKTQISFQHSEHLMIFLFYKCDEIDSEELQTWLSIGKKKKISKRGYGHPLTELVDDYHAHRVEFKSSKARDKFFREAKTPNKEMSIPFTSSRQCFRYYELNNHIIFVACQTLDMLESLKLSARMKEQQQTVFQIL